LYTQIVNLMLLAPEIQEVLVESAPMLKGKDPITERRLRLLAGEAYWHTQLDALLRFKLFTLLAHN